MVGNRKAAKRLVSTLGAALVAMLAFAVVASTALASPAWHINGKTLSEAGVTEEFVSFYEVKPITFENFSGLKVTCTSAGAGEGRIRGANEGSFSTKPTGCTIVGAPKTCKVEKLEIGGAIHLIEVGGLVYENISPANVSITTNSWACQFGPGTHIYGGSFALQVGPEAVKMSVTGSQAVAQATGSFIQMEGNGWFNISQTQLLNGMNKGAKLGAW